jgi:methylenetetrahydrofolate dehydrogenase (NADP+) / methenyltetrahydrofolate cyclohydrolase
VIMDGRSVGNKVRDRVKRELSVMKGSAVEPFLATILVGDDPASKTYLKNKHSACRDVGIASRNVELNVGTSQAELFRTIDDLNRDPGVTGILLQLPLPKGLDEASAIMQISTEKDVDGLHPFNLGQLWRKSARLVPCTPRGVVVLLKNYGVKIAGQRAVIINRTKLVGRPLSQLLLNEDATVTVCHSKTQNLKKITKEADILVTAIGRRQQFTVGPEMVKRGTAVVDVGTSILNGKLVGDVDFDSVIKVASFITPVPGGVGPMTIALLMYNTLVAAAGQKGVKLSFDPEHLEDS